MAADILNMTYSEMENLVKAFNTASDELKDIGTNAKNLLEDVQETINNNWNVDINKKVGVFDVIKNALDKVSLSIGDSWTGDRYETFSSDTYPSIQNAVSSMKKGLEDFKAQLTSQMQPFIEELTKLIDEIQKQSERCEEIANWILEYTLKHAGIEKGLSTDEINNIIKNGNGSIEERLTYSSAMLAAVKATGRNQTAANFDELNDYFSSNDKVVQGSTNIYNVHTTKNADGSGDITFTCSNSTKRTTEVTVYDANGNVVSVEYMDGQKDPDSISGVAHELVNSFKDMKNGKFLNTKTMHDGDFMNSKKDFSLHIPKGGYVRITEDASMIDKGTYVTEKVQDSTIDVISKMSDNVPLKGVAKVAAKTAKSAMIQNAKDGFNGTSSSAEDYAWNVGGTAVDTAIDVASEYMGPAGAGLEVIDGTLKVNSAFEKDIKVVQESKSVENGAFYICI